MSNSGKDALEKIEKLNPDITLMDIRMPEMSGIDVLEKVRELNIMV